jgi:hypothetical protein
MKKSDARTINGMIAKLVARFSELNEAGDSWLNQFAHVLMTRFSLFSKIGQAAKSRGVLGIEELFESEGSALWVWSDVYGRERDSWYYYFWSCLFPEKFVWSQKAGQGFVLKDGEEFGEREKTIILSLFMTPAGRRLLFSKDLESFRARFGRHLPWPEEIVRDLDELIGFVPFCSRCGKMFLVSRQGQKYCGAACRKADHNVPSSDRKDQTPRMYFTRKIEEDGLSREDAWKATLARHGKALAEIGKNGPEPPISWAKTKED